MVVAAILTTLVAVLAEWAAVIVVFAPETLCDVQASISVPSTLKCPSESSLRLRASVSAVSKKPGEDLLAPIQYLQNSMVSDGVFQSSKVPPAPRRYIPCKTGGKIHSDVA